MLLLLSLACVPNGGEGTCETWLDGSAPDCALEDVNATSDTYGDFVSPSDLLGRVSVWYFGHAT